VGGFAGAIGVRGEVAGLWEMRARFYDPQLGRFLSPDPWPATLPGPATLNRYAYALNDPISLVDPSGLFCWTGKNDAGKCRGVRDIAKRVSKPLEMVSIVATAVAVTSVGLTLVCPPCATVTLPLAGTLQTVANASRFVAIGAGLVATGAQCIGNGPTSFDCINAAVSETVGWSGGALVESRLIRLAESGALRYTADAVGKFGGGIFDVFMHGASGAVSALGK
ncbi:MAG TPA: RHS repeat-associated core domain-containing protein, partial [Acidimicrobiia bacterium]|nr:RHS repeat-associated core domain-containing protein [Acidimicrobiia bacterium]